MVPRSTVLAAIAVAALTALFAPAHADNRRAPTAERTSPSRIDSIRRGLARNFGLRPTVRNAIATERSQAKLGLISAAATSVTETRATIKPAGLRERFALWRSKRTVTHAAYKMADQRSAAGDTVGARDALDGLTTLQASGRARAENRAFKNAIKVAKRAAGKRTLFEINRRTYSPMAGDLDLGLDNLAFATDLKKGDASANRKLVRTARTIMNGGFKLAAKQAKAGDANSAWQLLEKAAVAADRGGVAFPEPTAKRILVQGFEISASQAFKAGAHDDAAASLYQALAIQRSLGERPSRATRKLEQKLMPRIRALEEAERNQPADAEGDQDSPASDANAP